MEKLDFAIIVSEKDPAGMNIAGQLRRLQKFPATIRGRKADIFVVGDELVHSENLEGRICAEVFIFASRHVSKAGIHSLTVHSIGNWGKAMAGGKDRSLVNCPAALMKSCLRILAGKAAAEKLDYEVVQEATHHGPYLEKQAMFIEIGSDEERWKDERAGKAVASAILEAINDISGNNGAAIKAAVGLGGLHYASGFGKAMLSDGAAVGHICPRHALGLLDGEMLIQAMHKSVPKADYAILDWKGLGKEKERIKRLLETPGIEYRKTADF